MNLGPPGPGTGPGGTGALRVTGTPVPMFRVGVTYRTYRLNLQESQLVSASVSRASSGPARASLALPPC